MSRRFIDLCKDVVSDLGIAGGTINSVTGTLNQEQLRIVNWVARADLFVQNLWIDWLFLWNADPAVLCQAGSDVLSPSLPTWARAIQSIERNSLWLGASSATARPVAYMEWDKFRDTFQRRVKQTSAMPVAFSRSPDGVLYLSHKMPQPSTFTLDYHCIGKRMVADNDTSRVPEAFDSIICERAKLFYAQRENAPEILTGSTAEYMDLLDKMQASCLPDNTAGRRSKNDPSSTPQAYVE